jgi:hypothetical protein
MAKSPNTTPSDDDNNNWSLRASYEYKYPGWVQSNPFVSAIFDAVETEETERTRGRACQRDSMARLRGI